MAGMNGSQVATEPEQDYQRKWKAFALRRTLALALLYGWLPFCGALFLLSRYSLHQPVASIVLMVVWLCGMVVAVWWAGDFRCPRCRRRYAALGHGGKGINLTRGLFDRICSNCRLTKFEHPGP
jgi:hypothetical protein